MTKKQQELKAVIDLVLNCQFETKRFSGDPLEWETFNDTFETAIEHNRNLTKIEKFTCLRGYLEGTALQQCLEYIKGEIWQSTTHNILPYKQFNRT